MKSMNTLKALEKIFLIIALVFAAVALDAWKINEVNT